MYKLIILSVLALTMAGCGTWPPNRYPGNLTHAQAMAQFYQCEREAQASIPQAMVPGATNNNDRWMYVARMKNACLQALGWYYE